MRTVHCAIYTRKSSDEGLEQAFNSLDAQREACAAYILSQASEGWTALPEIYDDGGISGGTLTRPALQRLLGEVDAGRVDIIVLYKIDRLTRSLFDFAKLVERFDKVGTSFVSITQSFNTTTSMGRLTLNMLLSFAQFEREVIAERVRDKIAASKAKGMWMGGTPPIGYTPNGRTLDIVEHEAALISNIFDRYIRLGSVRSVAEQLVQDGQLAPVRQTINGKPIGGIPLGRGQIYLILQNRLYLGEIQHKGNIYPGLHKGIVDRAVFDAVKAKLAENLQGQRDGTYAKSPSLLVGKVVDENNRPLTASHAQKGKQRYRYYVNQAAQAQGEPAVCIPARELEAVVIKQIKQVVADPLALTARCELDLQPLDLQRLLRCGNNDIGMLSVVRSLVSRVRVRRDAIDIECSIGAIARHLKLEQPKVGDATMTLPCDLRLTRSGQVVKLIQNNGRPLVETPDTALMRRVAKGHRWWAELQRGEIGMTEFAAQKKVSRSYVARVLRLAFLSPTVVDAILAGKVSGRFGCSELTATGAVAPNWAEQERLMLGY